MKTNIIWDPRLISQHARVKQKFQALHCTRFLNTFTLTSTTQCWDLHILTVTQSTRHTTSCLPSHSLKFGNDQSSLPISWISQVWLNHSQVELERLTGDMSELGPTITQVEMCEDYGSFLSEYKCRQLKSVFCHMHI
jgi:4-alpha-glucanotransferase